jgi:hypothetical protein
MLAALAISRGLADELIFPATFFRPALVLMCFSLSVWLLVRSWIFNRC